MRTVWRSCGEFGSFVATSNRIGQDGAVSTILVVEDERDIRELLRRYLERAGHAVLTASTGAEALRHVEASVADLVLLDFGLPDVDGFEVLQTAKRLGLPVIALTARSSVEERIRGLQNGADDYVTKPFSPQEVILRIASVLNRHALVSRDEIASFGHGLLHIDLVKHEARVRGTTLDLTPSEWGVITTLSGSPGRVFSRGELVNRVRGYEFAGYERTIDSHVKNLRRKLGDDVASIVETVLGVGYRFGLDRDQ
jgi:DNA-binding response OmpR family regulator